MTTQVYRAALVGCSRMGAFIDNEITPPTPIVFPYSHAAGYEACPRTELIAGADLRPDVLERFGQRYNVPRARRYTDYREMIVRERPDIVSIATQPEQRVQVILFAAEHGVRALYCEKPLCASMAEADAIVEAVERHSIVFNYGTNRRWYTGFDALIDVLRSGELGALQEIVLRGSGELFNTTSHWLDLVQRLNGDTPAAWVQAYLPRGEELIRGDWVSDDPDAQGTVAFANGVMAHLLLAPRAYDVEVICERGVLAATGTGLWFHRYRYSSDGAVRHLVEEPFPPFEQASSTLRLIEDIVHALDTGAPTRGGVRVARANVELIFGFIESHRRGGARVPLPLADNRLYFHRAGRQPGQPLYERKALARELAGAGTR